MRWTITGRWGRRGPAMGAALLVAALLSPVIGAPKAAAAAPTVTFSIDTTTGLKPISPLIYGLNDSATTNAGGFSTDLSSVRPTLIRQGGNRFTAYNWETNASNAGDDYCFENDNYLSSSTAPGAAVLATVQQANTSGAASLVTVPMAPYLANDINGGTCTLTDERNSPANIMNTPNYVVTRVLPNNPVDPVPLSPTPNLTDHNVYQDQFVYWLQHSAAPNTNVLFSLDNEPDFWPCTHAEAFPPPTIPASGACTNPYNGSQTVQTGQKMGFVDFVNLSLAYAKAIKNVWPGALVTGPALGGYAGFLQFQGANPSDMTNFGDFVDYYLTQVHAANAAAAKTLIDDFDFHWYPQNGVDDGDTSAATAAIREQTPRSLWDPTYKENSWITQCCSPSNGPIDLLPWLQGKINTDNPGMKMAITEWRYGAGNDISGAIADADALGLFGRYGINAATYWPDSDGTAYAHGAFEIYRNFDGHGASFGDTEVNASSSEGCQAAAPCYTSVYASTQSSDPSQLDIVAINKNTVAESATIDIKGFNSALASVYTLTSASPTPKPAASISAGTTSTFTYVMPPQSVSIIVPKLEQAQPVFSADTPPTKPVVGFPYSYTFHASGIPAPTYSLGSGALPTGLSLNATTGVLSGTPQSAGNFTFTITAHNTTPPDATSPSITIGVVAQAAPHFTADSPPAGASTTSAYSYVFHATGSPTPTYGLGSGAAPPGLKLNPSTGLLAGTPSAVGSFTFTVQASNGVTPAATSPPISIGVAAPPQGAVFDWGQGGDGQLGNGATSNQAKPVPVSLPPGVSIKQAAAGPNHTVAVTTNGAVYAWGDNSWGELGFTGANSSTPVLVNFPQGTKPIAQVTAGSNYSLALTTDGNVFGWGYDYSGELGHGSSGDATSTPTPLSLGAYLGKIKAIASAQMFSAALTTDGNVLAWGDNSFGELGNGTTTDSHTPVAVSLGSNAGTISAIAAGGQSDANHALALTASGHVLAWGDNTYGELGNGTVTNSDLPVNVLAPDRSSTLPPIKAIAAGAYHSLAVTTTGQALAWGANYFGELGNGSGSNSTVPTWVSPPSGTTKLPVITQVAAGYWNSLLLTNTRTVLTMGVADTLGTGATSNSNLPVTAALPAGTLIASIASAGEGGIAVVDTPAPLFSAQSAPTSAVVGVAYSYRFAASGAPVPTYSVEAGAMPAGLALNSSTGLLSGSPTATGTSSFTVQAANGISPAATAAVTITVVARTAPVLSPAAPPPGAQGAFYSYAFHATGAPAPTYSLAAGSLPAGLGLNATTGLLSGTPSTQGSSTFTVQAANGVSPAAQTPSLTVTIGVPPPGAVFAWGDGAQGQLGSGATANQARPEPVAFRAATTIVQVAAGRNHTVALASNAAVYAWGDNSEGELGSTGPNSSLPVAVRFPPGTAAVTQVSAGFDFNLARTSDGNVWAWGDNVDGMLGIGSDSNAFSTPMKVPLGSYAGKVKSVTAGVLFSLALTTDGNVLAWGDDVSGELGNGANSQSDTPVPVSLGTYAGEIVAIAAGGQFNSNHVLALTSSGAVLAWGGNENGELGDGTTANSNVPVLVMPVAGSATLPSISAVGAGDYHSLAVTTTGQILAWGDNSFGQIGTNGASSDLPEVVSPPAGMAAFPGAVTVAGGSYNSYALTSGGAVYTWGDNSRGQLGTGTTAGSNVPVAASLPAHTLIGQVGGGSDFVAGVVRSG